MFSNLSTFSEQYLNCYLDPVLSPSEICQHLKISESRYYRLERELKLPKLKVGLGHTLGSKITGRKNLNLFNLEYFDLQIIRYLARKLKVRLKLVADEHRRITEMLTQKKLNFALASIGTLPYKAKRYDFSVAYLPQITPNGILYGEPDKNLNDTPNKCLGVLKNTVHDTYGAPLFKDQYRILEFKSHGKLHESLHKGNINAAIIYSEFGRGLVASNPRLKTLSPRINYNESHTVVAVAKDQPILLAQINQALDHFHNDGLQEDLYEFCFKNENFRISVSKPSNTL